MATTYNPVIRNNETWEITLTLQDGTGAPLDLTGFTGQSQIKTHNRDSLLATLQVTVLSPLAGRVKVFLPLAQAVLLDPTPTNVNPKNRPPVWDVVLSNADQSRVYEVVEGEVTIRSGVTEWT
jgi:hypothetical protein